MGSLSLWHWVIVIRVIVMLCSAARQDLRADGRRGEGHQDLQEGNGRGRRGGASPRPSSTTPSAPMASEPAEKKAKVG